jgi:serine/threonine-protein kinase HipA
VTADTGAGTGGRSLVVLMGGHRAGVIRASSAGSLELTYEKEWQDSRTATPLSLSLPLARRRHPDAPVHAFLSGLLPDSEQVLARWARTYHVSARNPFALLRHVGEDCAGAAQFARPERVEALVAGEGGVTWLPEDEVADRIRVLRRDPSAWHVHDTGQFSLAGAQAKTALHHDPGSGRWGEPWGAVPTTHILKPAIADLDDHDLNEHLCLEAAHRVGLPAARSTIASFGLERVVVVDRYDRLRTPAGTVTRVHQEDLCQALGIGPLGKYQNEGGPSPEQVIELLRREVRPAGSAEASVGRLVDALAFNWIIGGTDAHAKNYSLLLAGSQVRLAPLYDVASVLPYDGFHLPKLKMAMKIGGEYRLAAIGGRHWRRFAEANGLDPARTLARVDSLAERVPGALAAAAGDEVVKELGSGLPSRLVDSVAGWATACRETLRD